MNSTFGSPPLPPAPPPFTRCGRSPKRMKIQLKPISPKRISDQVFDPLRELIFRGDYQPGQKIMTERELADALNVSRNSVREAINKLVTLRFLEQRQGQGNLRAFNGRSRENTAGHGYGGPGCQSYRPAGNAHGNRVYGRIAGGPAGQPGGSGCH